MLGSDGLELGMDAANEGVSLLRHRRNIAGDLQRLEFLRREEYRHDCPVLGKFSTES